MLDHWPPELREQGFELIDGLPSLVVKLRERKPVLTLTLRHLERDGLVTRTVHAEVPPRVEYALTATGKSLIAPALALAGWAIEHVPHIEASRATYHTRTW